MIRQQRRKRIEEIFGWLKTVGGLRKSRHHGLARVGWMFTFALAAYNLVRMRNLAERGSLIALQREKRPQKWFPGTVKKPLATRTELHGEQFGTD